jgi:hypothetical protein
MKFLLDKVAYGLQEWRILGDTRNTVTLVVTGDRALEFANRREAFNYVAAKYRQAADMRNLQPGQSYNLSMSDGTTKTVQVQNNTPQGINVMDPASGEVMTIPHLQQGAEPTPAQSQKPKIPGSPGGPTPTPNSGPSSYGASPENVTSALCADDLSRVTAAELGREPYNCKHDGGYLYRKDPSAPEKYCAQCGMVYAANNTIEEMERTAVITGGPGSYHVKSEEGKNLGGPYKTREQAEHRLKQVEYFKHKGDRTAGKCETCGGGNKSCKKCHGKPITPWKGSWADEQSKKAGCDSDYFVEGDDCDCPAHAKKAAWSPFDEAPVFPEGKPKVEWRPYRCMNCGKEKMISTNHLGRVSDYCDNCSWKPSFGNPEYQVPGPGGRTYRPFEYAGPSDRTVLQSRNAKIISEEKECSNCGGHGDLDDRGLCKKCRRKAMFRAWKNKERIVTAFEVIGADPAMPGQQAMPSAETSNMGETLKMDEKSPGEFAEEGETQPAGDINAKRQLTPHEIIEEAESLIRNALVKGVKIGADELSEYMSSYYSNGVQELMQGIALAWQKVQYEEGMEKGQQGDPNAPQGEGFGPKPPTTPEEAAQMAPKNGPIQTRRLS